MIPNRDQFYKITNKGKGNVMDVVPEDAPQELFLYWESDIDNQRWMFVPLNNNAYAIVNKNTGTVVDIVPEDAPENLFLYWWSGIDNQQWYLQDLEDGFQMIKSKSKGRVMDVVPEDAPQRLFLYWESGIDNQRWRPEPVEPITLPSIPTFSLPAPPQYTHINDTLPDYTPMTVTNYTLAPCIAVDDPWYNDQEKIQKGNEYYLYVREQYWKKVSSRVLAPNEEYGFKQTSGITETEQNTVSKTVGHTIGADVGLNFRDSASASLSYQYSEELSVQESRSTTDLTIKEEGLKIYNDKEDPVAWTHYILVSKYHVQRADGSTVNEPWSVVDPNNTYSCFYPLDAELPTYNVDIELLDAQQAVYNLFADAQSSTLKIDTTDYMIEQAALLVEQLSEEEYALEKMKLFNLVRCAKQISKKRNLLHYGDFASPNWRNAEDGWQASYNVTVSSDNPVFKGTYANMPGATTRGGNSTPTYLYQKVEESKLKPYTRYLVRGFVGSSKELELFITRYGKEVHTKMNLPARPANECQQTYGIQQVSDYTMSSDPCQRIYMPPVKEVCEDRQHFVFHIDVGEIYPKADLGIGVGFKISSPSGMAQLSNIEVIEANPLTGEALARVKKREEKWKREREQQCVQTEKAVSAATQAVNSLFTDAQKNRLKATTTVQDIRSAEAKVKAIPYVFNPYFDKVPGMNDAIYQSLQSDVSRASGLYQIRNIIRNGDFSSRLSNWHATAGADVQERDGKPHVLVISQWDASVSQEVCVRPEHGYVLRVTARKEESGKGYVTLTDCTAENTETVTFTSDDKVPTPRPPSPVEPGVCEMTRYSESFGIVPETSMMRNEQPKSYGTEACSCGCGKPSTSYQAQAYTSPANMPNVTGSASDYITKTIEIFPETNRLRIDIGETAGTFLVESVELMCMED